MDPITIYLGLSLGFSSSSMDSGSEPAPFSFVAPNPTAVNTAPLKIVDSGIAGRGYVGLRNKHFGVELGLAKLANWQQSREFTQPEQDVTGDIIRAKSIDLRFKGFMPVTDNLELYGYVAPTEVFWHREYWNWQMPWDNSGWSVQDGHNYSTGFGVGANYNIGKHAYISLEAGHNQAIGLSVNSVQVGVGYKF